MKADVCVVGAGFAGLAAARGARHSGAKVVLLEARDRVGGRTETVTIDNGLRVDVGGAWVGNDHERFRALAAEAGARLYPTYHTGDTLLEIAGSTRRYLGATPRIGLRAIASLAMAMLRVDRMAKKVPAHAPWTARGADALDAMSAGEWIDAHVGNRAANEFMHAYVQGFLTCGSKEVSMLGVLMAVSTTAGVQHTISVEGGAQQHLILEGTNVVSGYIAADLDDALHLSTPVRRIAQTSTGVRVEGDGVAVDADHVIVTVPLPITTRIEFDPPLPEARRSLAAALPVGCVIKSVAIYEEPFWRSEGLSGESASMSGIAELTLDSTAPGGPGAITAFTFGPTARAHGALSPEARRKAILDDLATRFGPRALNPVHFFDKDWAKDDWSAGCFAAHFPPGVLTSYGQALREPFGRIHWAGVETTTEHYCYIEGAIRSGERAAAEVAV